MEQPPHTFYVYKHILKDSLRGKWNISKMKGNFSIYFSFWMSGFVLEDLYVYQLGSSICGHIYGLNAAV